MGELIELISDPINAGIGGGALVALLLIARAIKKRRSQPTSAMARMDPNVKRCIAAGNYEAAARLEKQAGNYKSAMEFYLRAQKPALAAQMAERLERPVEAGELYEKAEDYRRAAKLYRNAGLSQRADELVDKHGDAARETTAITGVADGDALSLDGDALLGPADRAKKLEQTFAEAHGKAEAGDAEAQEQLSELGRQAAEALLSLGETRRAAELLHHAGLTDQAINLYVNLLGDPAAAAGLLAERGDHKRAAELYEVAGEQQRALAAWVEWSEGADDPLAHIEQVARLGDDAVARMLDRVVERRPATTDNLELHYRIATTLEQHQRFGPAMRVLEGIVEVDPAFRDTRQRLGAVRPRAEREAAQAPPPDAGLASTPNLPLPSLDLEPPSLDPPGLDLDLGDLAAPASDGPMTPAAGPAPAEPTPTPAGALPGLPELPALGDLAPPPEIAPPTDLAPETPKPAQPEDLATAQTMFGGNPLDLPAPGDLPRAERPAEPAARPAPAPIALPDGDPSLTIERSTARVDVTPAAEPPAAAPAAPAPPPAQVTPKATNAPAVDDPAKGRTILGQLGAAPPAAPAAPQPQVTQGGRPPMPAGLDAPAIERLVSEAATAAATQAAALVQARSPSGLLPAVSIGSASSSAARRRAEPARGVERISINLSYLADDAVRAAQIGPRATDLAQQIGGREPDLQNVELFYRMGLAELAAGNWSEAQQAFEAVEEASPGYRDAGKRAGEITHWKRAVTEARRDERYRLLGELGRGGMAVVYRAHDDALDREVALKFLSDSATQGSMMMQLFQREAKSAAQLNHPNIVTVYDVGTMDGRAFIAMELVVGTTVEQLLENGRMQVLDALRIGDAMLSALEYAHGKQIIHRDIKPSNMMRSELGVVKLMDFGLAKSIEEGKAAKTTMVAGTPQYMAPEQFEGKNVDESSDLFALGASLYEMLAGQPAFEGMRRDKPPVPLRKHNPTVPRLLEQLVHRAVELEQDKRYRRASEMARPLRQILSATSAFVSRHAAPSGPADGADPAPATPQAPAEPPAAAQKPQTPKLPSAQPQVTTDAGTILFGGVQDLDQLKAKKR